MREARLARSVARCSAAARLRTASSKETRPPLPGASRMRALWPLECVRTLPVLLRGMALFPLRAHGLSCDAGPDVQLACRLVGSTFDGVGPYISWLVIFRAKDVPGEWVAHALEFDVVTQGSSAEQARLMAIEAVRVVLDEDLRLGRDPYAHRAPPPCWEPLFRTLETGRPIARSEFPKELQAASESSVFVVQMVFSTANAELNEPSTRDVSYAPYVAPASQSFASSPPPAC
jgi:hypothetical protein